jgi:hypothetical protein
MKILAIEKETPGTTNEQFAPLLRQEAERAWELYRSGTVRELYFRADREEAVLILECPGLEEALHALESLPLAQSGLISFDLIPLVPYPGFERLFGTPRGDRDPA